MKISCFAQRANRLCDQGLRLQAVSPRPWRMGAIPRMLTKICLPARSACFSAAASGIMLHRKPVFRAFLLLKML
jgi:hypothetical protein